MELIKVTFSIPRNNKVGGSHIVGIQQLRATSHFGHVLPPGREAFKPQLLGKNRVRERANGDPPSLLVSFLEATRDPLSAIG